MFTVLLICMGIAVKHAILGNAQDFAVRLVNSFRSTSNEGRLEIYYSGIWGTVCDDYFTDVSARVACASLGFGYVGEVVGTRHGAGTGPIWLDGVNCTGTETGIEQCAHNDWGTHSCSHREDVSISCECGIRNFSGPTGTISSPNFPMQYANNLECYNHIAVPSGQTLTITFLAFLTQPTSDWLTITCASKSTLATRYSGLDFPVILTISSCNCVTVTFHTDNSSVYTGFSLTYNITSDSVVGGITTRPSNAFPRSDKDTPLIFNCSTTSKFLPWWTFNNGLFGTVTTTNSTCGVITSLRFSFWLKTETFGPGSCNLIAVGPAHILNRFAGSLVCTDSTLSTARALILPVNLGLRSTRSTNALAAGSGVSGDEEIRISCNPSFTDSYRPVFTYFPHVVGPVVQVRILRTYWTSQGNVISGSDSSNTSSYVVVKVPKAGDILRYACNIDCDLFTNVSDIAANSTTELSFIIYLSDLACANRNFSGVTGQISSSNFSKYTDCYNNYIIVPTEQTIIISFLALNTQNNNARVTISCDSGHAFTPQRYSGSQLPPILTISSCNIVTVHFHTENISISDTSFSLTYNITAETVIGGFTTKPSNAFPRSDKNDPIVFNCSTKSQYIPWWAINDKSSRNYTITNSTCEVITSALYSSWFMTETLGPGSCNLIVVAPADKRHLLAGTVVCTDSTLASARAILAPINLKLRLTRSSNPQATATDIVRDEDLRISCGSSFTFWESRPSLDFTYLLYTGGSVVQMRISRTYWTSEGSDLSSTDTSDFSRSGSYVSLKAPIGVIPRHSCNVVLLFFSNISDISGNSSVTLSFSTDPVDVLYWPTEDNMRISGDSNGYILTSGLLFCNVFANPPAAYKWIDESNGNITDGQSIQITHSGTYTCNVSNIIRGQCNQLSKSITVNIVEDKRLQNLAILILLGVAILTIIVILVIHLNRTRQQQGRNTAVDGIAYELRQRGRKSNDCNASCGNSDDVSEPGYDKLNKTPSQRCLPAIPSIYSELLTQELPQTGGECNLYEAYSESDIDVDGPDYARPDACQRSLSNISAVDGVIV